MTDNPYSTPSTDIIGEAASKPDEAAEVSTLGAIAKQTFIAWEKLRLVFIACLAALTLLVVGTSLIRLPTLLLVAEGAIVANICFFAGPIVETYVRWLGYDRIWVRWFLFIGGLSLTSVLAIATLMNMI